jgi:ABC-type transport system involved in cytochrome c biogenesis permease component
MQMVVQRELQVAARRSGTYWARFIAGGIAAIAILQQTGGISNGRRLFFTAVTLAAIVTFYEGMRRATAAIAKEKREGTLGLLLLTPLTGPELMRGKFAAIALSTFQTGLAAVPVLAASLLFGGVSAGEFARAIIALAHGLSLVIVLGLAVSTNAKDEETPNAPIGFVVAAAGIFATLIWTIPRFRWINPMTPILEISDGEYGISPWGFWISIALWQAMGWLKLRAHGRALIEMVRAREEAAFTQRAPVRIENWKDKSGDFVPGRINDAPRWFDGNPMEWYTLRDVGMHVGRWGALIMTIAAAACVMIFPGAGQVVWFIGFGTLLISLCVTSARPIARLHEWGALELMITTPLGERGILEGHMSGLKNCFFGRSWWRSWRQPICFSGEFFRWARTR